MTEGPPGTDLLDLLILGAGPTGVATDIRDAS